MPWFPTMLALLMPRRTYPRSAAITPSTASSP